MRNDNLASTRRGMFAVAALLLAMLALGGCGSHGRALTGSVQPAAAPSAGDLELMLNAELRAQGKDPQRTPASVPTGANGVFDLFGTVIDPDGAGPGAPTGVDLAWTERLLGDFDENGEVNAADLKPLALGLGQHVDYQLPVNAAGRKDWPTGDPLDDGGSGLSAPSAPGSPAQNWYLARVDGDGNGEINVSDIKVIGSHFHESLDGYRVYRRGPGESSFTLLVNPNDPQLPLTLPRLQAMAQYPNNVPAPQHPVRYALADYFGAPGVYEYKVVPYFGASGEEGQASRTFLIDSSSGQPVAGAPIAVFSATPDNGVSPLNVSFDASASGGNIVRYEWDFDGDGLFDANTGVAPTVQHTYDQNSTYTALLRVTDNIGQISEYSAPISVRSPLGNKPPQAAVSADVIEGNLPLTVHFDASASSDEDGSIVKYDWDYDGDGTFDETTAAAAGTFVFPDNASYTTLVRVTDDQGGVSIATVLITVLSATGNHPPTAVLTADKLAGNPPLSVQFDGSGSTDSDGTLALYEWDLDGNGTYDINTATVPFASMSYTSVGQFVAKLRVTDDKGGYAVRGVVIRTDQQQAANVAPSVSLNATPTAGLVTYVNNGNGTYTNQGMTVDFDANAIDTDGSIAKYEWDFDGDGVFNSSSGTSGTTSYAYMQAGKYFARVRVIDNEGAVGVSQAISITVNNTAPLAVVTYLPQPALPDVAVETPGTITLSADNSRDIDGQIIKYEWDLNGDGQFTRDSAGQMVAPDIDSGFQPNITVNYDSAVVKTDHFNVRLTDSQGGQTVKSIDVPLKDDFDEVEDNDFASTSTDVKVSGATLNLRGNIGGVAPHGYNSDDTDWYRLDIDAAHTLTLNLLDYTPATADLNLYVYDENGTTLLGSSVKADVTDSVTGLTFLAQKTIFVKVSRFSSTTLDPINYTLQVVPGTIALKEVEPNNSSATAQPIGSADFGPNGHLLDWYGAFSTASGDPHNNNEDWYSWALPSGVDIFVDLYFRHLDADLDVYLYNPAGQIVAASTGSTDDEHIAPGQLAGGDYKLRVVRVHGADCIYRLDLRGSGVLQYWPIKGVSYEEEPIGGTFTALKIKVKDLGTGVTTNFIRGYNTGEFKDYPKWTIALPNGTYSISIDGYDNYDAATNSVTGAPVGTSNHLGYEDSNAGLVTFSNDISQATEQFEVVDGDINFTGTLGTHAPLTANPPIYTWEHT